MASQDARLSKFKADFKQQPSEMTNKIDTVLKAFTDRIAEALPIDTGKNPKLNVNFTTLVFPKQPNKPQNDELKREYQEENSNLENINTTLPSPHDPSNSFIMEKVRKLNLFLESSGLVPQSSDTEIACTKGDDGDIMFIEIIRKNDDSHEEGPEYEGSTMIEGLEVEYFDTFPTRSELAYHRKLDPREDTNRGVSNFTRRIKGMHVFIGNFTYVLGFMIVEDISSIIDPRLSQIVLGKPFVEISNMTHDPPEGLVRNEEDKKRGVEYMMSKILGFYKECLELRPEYLTGVADKDEVTKFLIKTKRKSSQCVETMSGLNSTASRLQQSFGKHLEEIHMNLTQFGKKQDKDASPRDEVFLTLGWHFEEIHMTWAHLEKKQTRLRLYTKNHEELCIQSVETGVAIIKQRHQDLHRDGIKDLATASGRGRIKEDLESSTWRRRQDFKAMPSCHFHYKYKTDFRVLSV
ncbi:hypothetical protein Tco_0337070 [Tanacetum coccineum]